MDYYAILEIKYGATPEEIKKAFFRLAKIHHPDKGGDEVKFKEINNAYQELCKNPQYQKVHYSPETDRSRSAAAAEKSFADILQDFVNRANTMKQNQENLRNQQKGFYNFTAEFSGQNIGFDTAGKSYKLVKNPQTGHYEWIAMW